MWDSLLVPHKALKVTQSPGWIPESVLASRVNQCRQKQICQQKNWDQIRFGRTFCYYCMGWLSSSLYFINSVYFSKMFIFFFRFSLTFGLFSKETQFKHPTIKNLSRINLTSLISVYSEHLICVKYYEYVSALRPKKAKFWQARE